MHKEKVSNIKRESKKKENKSGREVVKIWFGGTV